jgi:hypothetical protein
MNITATRAACICCITGGLIAGNNNYRQSDKKERLSHMSVFGIEKVMILFM